MYCPNCGQEQRCPCDACLRRHGKTDVWKWKVGDLVTCCGCGLTAHVDWWQCVSLDIYKAFTNERLGLTPEQASLVMHRTSDIDANEKERGG